VSGDLSEEEQRVVWATQGVPVANLLEQKMGGTAWRSKPSWYIVAKNDRTVHPELQRFAAKRMTANTTGLDSSHVPMLSKPGLVLDVIRKAAAAVQKLFMEPSALQPHLGSNSRTRLGNDNEGRHLSPGGVATSVLQGYHSLFEPGAIDPSGIELAHRYTQVWKPVHDPTRFRRYVRARPGSSARLF
jgi:hypothetical protein